MSKVKIVDRLMSSRIENVSQLEIVVVTMPIIKDVLLHKMTM